jgi:hypothetical protein
MCWNREVSILTGTTATLLSAYLLLHGKGNDIPIAFVSFAIALMQFAEAFLWNAIDTGQPSAIGGRLGLLALFLQPLLLSSGIAIARKAAPWVHGLIVIVWGILAIPTLSRLLPQTWPAHEGRCGHLQWSFLEPMLSSPFAPAYWGVMLGGWLFMKPFAEGLHYAVMAVATLGITWQFFPGEWGSLWCFLANMLPLGRIL